MDIFDRLGNLIKTILDEEPAEGGTPYQHGYRDPDMRQAWEELESYMNEDAAGRADRSRGPETRTRPGVPEYLKKDFRNLEVPFGAPLSDVRHSYKRLMAAFHPDRHSADPDRFKTATEVTKKLNQSFQKIRSYYETETE